MIPDNNLTNQIIKICDVLNSHEVEYLIVGGTALALHGHFRYTRDPRGNISDKFDFDFWYNPSYENYYKLLRVFDQLGIDTTRYREDKSPNPKKSFFKHEFDEFKVDFLPQIKGLEKFIQSDIQSEEIKINDITIKFLSVEDLIKSKEATARDKDKDDLEELRLISKIKKDKNEE
ncbi:MAG: nucleotidyltransferase [Bacteroidota bacterium]